MSDIQIERDHSLSLDNVRSLTEEVGSKLKSKYGGDYQMNGDTMCYKTSGVNAELRFDESNLCVNVKLGMLMKAFKGNIQTEVQRFLDEHIA